MVAVAVNAVARVQVCDILGDQSMEQQTISYYMFIAKSDQDAVNPSSCSIKPGRIDAMPSSPP